MLLPAGSAVTGSRSVPCEPTEFCTFSNPIRLTFRLHVFFVFSWTTLTVFVSCLTGGTSLALAMCVQSKKNWLRSKKDTLTGFNATDQALSHKGTRTNKNFDRRTLVVDLLKIASTHGNTNMWLVIYFKVALQMLWPFEN